MSKKQKTAQDLASKLAFQILSLDKIEKDAKAEKEKLKEDLTALCNSVYDDEFQNGSWELPEADAVVKLALNPHKVIDTRSGKALDPKTRQDIAMHVADKYCVVDLNVREIQASLEHDKQLKKVLQNNHLQVVQETRYDVKKLK
jgi:hypothetical protein